MISYEFERCGDGRLELDGRSGRDDMLTCRVEVLRRPRDFVQHHLTSMFMSRFGGNLLTADGDVSSDFLASPIENKQISCLFVWERWGKDLY